jgi:hypothetical protein
MQIAVEKSRPEAVGISLVGTRRPAVESDFRPPLRDSSQKPLSATTGIPCSSPITSSGKRRRLRASHSSLSLGVRAGGWRRTETSRVCGGTLPQRVRDNRPEYAREVDGDRTRRPGSGTVG